MSTLSLKKLSVEPSLRTNRYGIVTYGEMYYAVITDGDTLTLADAHNYIYANANTEILTNKTDWTGSAKTLPLNYFENTGRESAKIIKFTGVYQYTASSNSKTSRFEKPRSSFDCSTGSTHIKNAISETVVKGDTAGGTIGWNGKIGDDLAIDGVDVPIAEMRETYTKTMSTSDLDTRYKRLVASAVGKVNLKTFNGWSEGEVQFLGMSYSDVKTTDSEVVCTFQFLIRPNETDYTIDDQTISKEGFEYVWATYDNIIEDGVPKVQYKDIIKNQVFKKIDFRILGL